MELLKDTPFEVAWRVWQARPPARSLTVVVKGTFTIPREGTCEIADEQALPQGDIHWDDDAARSVYYPSDMEPLKPRGECFVIGSFHAPAGAPMRHGKASLELGAVKKQVAVIGDREWKRSSMGETQPFEVMPLRWERSFGGPGNALNPVGRGEDPIEVDRVFRPMLPNLENPERLVLDRRDTPAPIGFGPLSRSWPSRRALAGTYDAAWQKTRYPHYPADLDWRFFNAAPADQQIEGYWRGDETLSLRHLHPEHARVDCVLPGLRAQAFLTNQERGLFTDVGLKLDTIVIDADRGLAHCVWRGLTEVAREDLEDIQHLYVVHHAANDAPGLEGHRAQYADKVAIDAALDAAELADMSIPPAGPVHTASTAEERKVVTLAEEADEPGARWAHLDQALTMQGGNDALAAAFRYAAKQNPGVIESVLDDALGLERPISTDRQLTQEELLELEMMLSLSMVIDRREKDQGRMKLREAIAAGETELRGLDLASADLSEMDLTGLDLRLAILVRANLSGSTLSRCRFEGAVLDEAELSQAAFDECGLADTRMAHVRAQRARFRHTRLDDAEMQGCFLREARFVGCSLRRVILAGSDLSESTIQESALDEADLSQATLERVRFRKCTLRDASIEGAKADRLNLDGCDASLLRASESTILNGATFKQATLDGARFSTASLRRADFSLATLSRADFRKALMLEAVFTGCDLRWARFDEANLIRVSLVRANLMEARLEGADLTFADARGASLFRAELLGATMKDARLDGTTLTGTRLA